MDTMYCKTQLAWAALNMQDAQRHIDNGDSNSTYNDLDFAERAIARVRKNLQSKPR